MSDEGKFVVDIEKKANELYEILKLKEGFQLEHISDPLHEFARDVRKEAFNEQKPKIGDRAGEDRHFAHDENIGIGKNAGSG